MRAWLAAFLAAACAGAASGREDLTPELKQALAALEAKAEALDERAARLSAEDAERGVRELRQQLKEFAIDAEILDHSPLLAKATKALAGVAAKAAAGEQRRAAAMAADAARREKEMAPRRDFGKEIAGIARIKRDLTNVSFKRDVAPIVQNACVRCHGGAKPGGGFDASTYAHLLEHVKVGDAENSHVMKLVTGRAQPRMPRGGQARFDREWVEIWSAWINQGAKFDGTSKEAPIASYLIDLDVQRREALAKLPAPELDKLHRAIADRHLAIVKPDKAVQRFETPNFLVATTLPEADVEYLGVLAEATLEDAQKKLGQPSGVVFRGRMGLNVFADRADYTSFAKLVDNYAPETYEFGHVRLTPEFSYAAASADRTGGTLDGVVARIVAEAHAKQLGNGKLPQWVAHGFAAVAASGLAPRDPLVQQELAASARLVLSGKTFNHLCGEDGSWQELGPLATGFFHCLSAAGQRKPHDFLKGYARGGDWQAGLNAVGVSAQEATAGWQSYSARGGRR